MQRVNLIEKTPNLLVEAENQDSASGEYPLSDQTIVAELHSLSFVSGTSLSLIPPLFGDVDEDDEENRFSRLLEDKENGSTDSERIEARAEIERDGISIVGVEEGELGRHFQIDVVMRPVPEKTDKEPDEIEGEAREFVIIKSGSVLSHFCGDTLAWVKRDRDFILAEFYLLPHVFEGLKNAILDHSEHPLGKITIALKARLFQSRMDADLREPWMRQEFFLKRDSRTKCWLTNLQIHYQAVIEKPKDEDEEFEQIEPDEDIFSNTERSDEAAEGHTDVLRIQATLSTISRSLIAIAMILAASAGIILTK